MVPERVEIFLPTASPLAIFFGKVKPVIGNSDLINGIGNPIRKKPIGKLFRRKTVAQILFLHYNEIRD